MAIRRINGVLKSGTRYNVSDNVVQFDTDGIHIGWHTRQLSVHKMIHDDDSLSWFVSGHKDFSLIHIELSEDEATLFANALGVSIVVLEEEEWHLEEWED